MEVGEYEENASYNTEGGKGQQYYPSYPYTPHEDVFLHAARQGKLLTMLSVTVLSIMTHSSRTKWQAKLKVCNNSQIALID